MFTEVACSEIVLLVCNEIISLHEHTLDPERYEQVVRAFVHKGYVLGGLGRPDDALEALGEATSRTVRSPTPALRPFLQGALLGTGVALAQVGRPGEALAACDEITERFRDAGDPALRGCSASALVAKGELLWRDGREEQALAVWNDVVSRHGGDGSLRDVTSEASLQIPTALFGLRRFDESVAAVDELVTRFGLDDDDEIQVRVGRALLLKGLALAMLNRVDEAIVVWRGIGARLADAATSDSASAVVVARALRLEARALLEVGRPGDARLVLSDLVGRFEHSGISAVREAMLNALVDQADRARADASWEEVRVVCSEIVRVFGHKSDIPASRREVLRALSSSSTALVALGRLEEAQAALDRLFGFVTKATINEDVELLAEALYAQAFILPLLLLRSPQTLLASADALETRFGHVTHPEIECVVAWALVWKAIALRHIARFEDAIVVCDEVVFRYGTRTELRVRAAVAQALSGKRLQLRELGRDREAAAVQDELIRRFGSASEPELRRFADPLHEWYVASG